MSTILLFGAEGQVGWELQRSLSVLGTVVPLARAQVDLADSEAVRTTIRKVQPRAIVNAAAYTAVDKAETEREAAFAINAHAPTVMAAEAAAAGIPLIHFSSDYVYDGRKNGRYVESDATNPQSEYARSKLAGDMAVLAAEAQTVVLRTSWVYAARGSNFLRTILKLAGERASLPVVGDQVGAPTSAELLADVTAQILPQLYRDKSLRGLFHCAAAGETSWHGYAVFLVRRARALGAALTLSPERIDAITTAQYPRPAARPANSRLDCALLETTFGLRMPDWQLHVERTLTELLK